METIEFLRKVDIFKYVDAEGLNQLASQVRLISLPEGTIMRSNDDVDGLYIIKSGAVGVTKAAESGVAEALLATLRQGASFGEIGLLDGLPRSANVSALEPLECYYLSRESFLNALEEHPEIARGMLPALATMVRNTNKMVAELLSI